MDLDNRGTLGGGTGASARSFGVGNNDGVGETAQPRRVAIFAKALRTGDPKRSGVVLVGALDAVSRCNMSSAVCFRYVSAVNLGKAIFSGKKLTVRTSCSFMVSGK